MEIVKSLLQTGVKNKNGRLYPYDVFKKALEEYEKKIAEGRALGELDHPDSFDVSFSNVSHVVREIYSKFPKVPRKKKKALKKVGLYKKTEYFVRYEILDTEKGREAKKIISDLAPSPRGTGTIINGVIQDDYRLFAIDLIDKKDKA